LLSWGEGINRITEAVNNRMGNKTLNNTTALPYKLKVYLEDTDAGGFVYYANYLKYLERARTEVLYHKGVCHAQLLHIQKTMFVVSSLNINFLAPACLADELNIHTDIESVKGARVFLKQSIVRDNQLLVQANIVLAYINLDNLLKKPLRIPDFIISALLPNGFRNLDSKMRLMRPECTQKYMRTREVEIFEDESSKDEGYTSKTEE
jgi:acyl-CoA thioester hydrolase